MKNCRSCTRGFEDRLAAAHAEAEALRTDRDQLAAARLQIANLHTALVDCVNELGSDPPDEGVDARARAALAESEPSWLPLLADIRLIADGAWMVSNIDCDPREAELVMVAAKRVLDAIGPGE